MVAASRSRTKMRACSHKMKTGHLPDLEIQSPIVLVDGVGGQSPRRVMVTEQRFYAEEGGVRKL